MPTGFGGPSPGTSILTGVAQGEIDRKKRQSELKRRAILNRLTNARVDQARTRQRLAREEGDRKQKLFERTREAIQTAAPHIKDYLQERDRLPDEAEEITAEGLFKLLEGEGTVADLERAESRTGLNRLRRRKGLRDLRVAKEAAELASDPDIFSLATADWITSEPIRTDVMRSRLEKKGIDVSDEGFKRFMEWSRNVREQFGQAPEIGEQPVGSLAGGARGDMTRTDQLESLAQEWLSRNDGNGSRALQRLANRIEQWQRSSEPGAQQRAQQLMLIYEQLQQDVEGGSSVPRVQIRGGSTSPQAPGSGGPR